jgi:hypothetical protein
LVVNEKVIRNRQNIADVLNNFFFSVVDDNINNNAITTNNPLDFLRLVVDHSYQRIKYHPVTTLELATAACRRSDCQLLQIDGATWSA